MNCEFKIKTAILKNITQLLAKLLPDSEVYILFEVAAGMLSVKAGCMGCWLEQRVSVDSVVDGSCVFSLDALVKIKFPGAETHFKSEEKAIKFRSGRFRGVISAIGTKEKVLINAPKKIVETTHKFKHTSLVSGLKLLAFEPISASTKKKQTIKIVVRKGKVLLSAQDDYRGALYVIEEGAVGSDIELVIEYGPLQSIMSLFPSGTEYVSVGTTDRFIRLQGCNMEYQCPFRPGTVLDVEKMLYNYINQKEPKHSFCLDAKTFKGALATVCGAASLSGKDVEVKLGVKAIKGITEKGKPVEDTVELFSSTNIAKTLYQMSAYNVTGEVTVHTSDKMIKDLLLMNGLLQFNLYEKVIVLESLDCNFKAVIPQLPGKAK